MAQATRIIYYMDNFIEETIKRQTNTQTVHQRSDHENPGFVAAVVSRWRENDEKKFVRCNGVFLTGRFIITSEDCLWEEIESVQATSFPFESDFQERKYASSWYYKDDVGLVYFRQRFRNVRFVGRPRPNHLATIEQFSLRLSYFNPLVAQNFRRERDLWRGNVVSMTPGIC